VFEGCKVRERVAPERPVDHTALAQVKDCIVSLYEREGRTVRVESALIRRETVLEIAFEVGETPRE
jgi:hypothetical protein